MRKKKPSAHLQADRGARCVERRLDCPSWVYNSEEGARSLSTSPFLLPSQTPCLSSTHKGHTPPVSPPMTHSPAHCVEDRICILLPSASKRSRGCFQLGGRRDLSMETFFFKTARNKQMVLQPTGIALGWKFKMH